jgi:hypothetical protein
MERLMSEHERLATAFVGLVDTLVADYDAVDLAQNLVDSATSLLPIRAAGILLGDAEGTLHSFAASSDDVRLLEEVQMQAGAGPCLDAYRSGEPVIVEDLRRSAPKWPTFAAHADQCDVRAVAALPMRLRDQRVGGLNLFLSQPGSLTSAHIAVGQALADVATIGIVHLQVLSASLQVTQQLETALETRVVIEQAKGVVAERVHVDMDQAFGLLRGQARRTNRRLTDLAQAVVEGEVPIDVLDDDRSGRPSRGDATKGQPSRRRRRSDRTGMT